MRKKGMFFDVRIIVAAFIIFAIVITGFYLSSQSQLIVVNNPQFETGIKSTYKGFAFWDSKAWNNGVTSISEDSFLITSKNMGSTSTSAYAVSVSNIDSYDEVIIDVEYASAQAIPGPTDSSEGRGSAVIAIAGNDPGKIDDSSLLLLDTSCTSTSTSPECKRFIDSFGYGSTFKGTLKAVNNNDGTWNVYKNGDFTGKVGTGGQDNHLVFYTQGFTSGGQGYSTIQLKDLKLVEKGGTIPGINPPSPPRVSFSVSAFFSKLSDFIKSLFPGLALSIVGPSQVQPNSQATYTITLNAPSPVDSDYSDGTVSFRKCSAALVDKNFATTQKALQYLEFEDCENSWTKTWTINTPTNFGNYLIIAGMVESKGVYDPSVASGPCGPSWSCSEYESIVQEGYPLTSKAPKPIITPSPSTNFFAKFLDFIKRIFGIGG